jgi:ABC-type lipoprotein export system ATPase subunit
VSSLDSVIIRTQNVKKTARLSQLSGLFDLSLPTKSETKYEISLPLPENWHVGVIVGPSGSGKTTIANHFWGEKLNKKLVWSQDKSIIDDFPTSMSIKDICGLLSSIGFSSPPHWVRSFANLSNGEQFRVSIARQIAESGNDLIVIDEFSSVVDRLVAKIASSSVQKAIRRLDKQIILLSCHYDILEWLEPDWIYDTATKEFNSGRLLRRPRIEIEIAKGNNQAWEHFKDYHYLSNTDHSKNIYLAFIDDCPVAYCSVSHFPHPVSSKWRISRLVTHPDWQGVGIGRTLLDYVASTLTGKDVIITSSNPAIRVMLDHSKNWRCSRKASLSPRPGKTSEYKTYSTNRMVSSYIYFGGK